MRTTLCLLALALAGCGDSTTDDAGTGGNDAATGADAATGDAGGTDAGGTDAGDTDAGDTDAGELADAGDTDAGGADAAVALDGGACATCLAAAYEFGSDGGLVPERRRSRIEPCQDFTQTRVGLGSGGSTRMCESVIPSCDDTTGAITTDDVVRAFAHPDVVAAFAAAPVLYGSDTRPVDGSVFQIQAVGGGLVEVGFDCTGAPACTPIPPGVAALRSLLGQLETQQLALPDCSTTFAP
ncbi:MAG: hypothetical protein KC619_12880 [Myxococcales bacterium]|nr:hypothetical protein [Myxococcales bacterium]